MRGVVHLRVRNTIALSIVPVGPPLLTQQAGASEFWSEPLEKINSIRRSLLPAVLEVEATSRSVVFQQIHMLQRPRR